jgi:hypothetical protein
VGVQAQQRPLGEKVPAAAGAVADGLGLDQAPAAAGQGAWLAADGTGAAAVGAGLLVPESLGL